MKRIFFDTNVILDQLDSAREGHSNMVLLEKKMEEIGASPLCAWHSLSIIEYVARKTFSQETLLLILRGIIENFTIPKTGTEEAREAFLFLHHDFEDAMQIATAQAGQADFIITNDKSGFINSPIPVVTPEECLKLLSSHQR